MIVSFRDTTSSFAVETSLLGVLQQARAGEARPSWQTDPMLYRSAAGCKGSTASGEDQGLEIWLGLGLGLGQGAVSGFGFVFGCGQEV